MMITCQGWFTNVINVINNVINVIQIIKFGEGVCVGGREYMETFCSQFCYKPKSTLQI